MLADHMRRKHIGQARRAFEGNDRSDVFVGETAIELRVFLKEADGVTDKCFSLWAAGSGFDGFLNLGFEEWLSLQILDDFDSPGAFDDKLNGIVLRLALEANNVDQRGGGIDVVRLRRSEEHTSELQS